MTHVTAVIMLKAELTVRVWGEHMTAEELKELLAREREGLRIAVEEAVRCGEREIGFTVDGSRAAFLTEILETCCGKIGQPEIDPQ